ncbi:MAG TPA: endonuclease/exonuclease/phosphatase family protein, partial [Thermoanaerobaculia bacterium]|nr:endonuclease/exonuclease/phosphatase family protein [Thermoanaerobaculia bacterium]
MRSVVRALAAAAMVVPVVGTILSLIRHPHWIFRLWDFPRVQLASISAMGMVAWLRHVRRRTPAERALVGAAGLAIGWQLYKIHPYTPLRRRQVKWAERSDPENTISVLVSNVLMENDDQQRLIDTVKERQPDVLLAVETDEPWAEALEDALGDDYPYRILRPQDNYYGMVLFSKLKMKGGVRFLVQGDIPSIHAQVILR